MSIIDEKLAKAFLNDPDNVDLSEATEITDEAAESLSKYKDPLNLDGLTELSDAAAESISKHKGGELYLEGLTQLTHYAAGSFSKYEGTIDFEDPKQWIESLPPYWRKEPDGTFTTRQDRMENV